MQHFGPIRMIVLTLSTLLAPAFAQADVDRRNAITEAIDKAKSAIVCLKTLRVIPARFENVDSGRVKGLGTGVIIDPRGYIVTNYHVVEEVDEIEARTADGRRFSAAIVETDRRNDLAILRINAAQNLPNLSLAGVGMGIPGETVIAIGNPYGLEESVTIGIVSAVDRELKLPNGEVFNGLLQTDASINPGNSGGPLITINGDLLGINVAIRSNAQGIAFAIPTERVRQIIGKMMTRAGNATITGLDVEENPIQKVGGVPSPPGGVLRVRQVDPKSSAGQAGIKDGDEILSVSGHPIGTRFDLDRAFWGRKAGETIPVKVSRNGQEQDVHLTVGPNESDDAYVWNKFGISTRPVVDPVRRVQPKWEGGLLVLEVRPGSPAEKAGIHAGDILAGLNDHMTLVAHHIRQIMKADNFAPNQQIRYHVIRDGQAVPGKITFAGDE